MNLKSDCLSCLLNQSLRVAKNLNLDEETSKKMMKVASSSEFEKVFETNFAINDEVKFLQRIKKAKSFMIIWDNVTLLEAKAHLYLCKIKFNFNITFN